MLESQGSTKRSNQLSTIPQAAAGYTNRLRSFDEEADHRRMTDGVLHWQCRPKVYPFREQASNKEYKAQSSELKDVSLYTSEFFEKPIAIRKFRPSSINRRNNPHPNAAFHVKHMLNQKVPVVRTRMTLEEFYRKPIDSPFISNTHRVYRKYDPTEIVRVKPMKQVAESVSGIVPELQQNDSSTSLEDTKLFPVIPRNTRLTADRAQGIANAGIKPRRNKYQPHLKGAGSSISGASFPFRSETTDTKPSLKPRPGYPADSIVSASWDGAPKESARTTFSVMGRKKADKSKIEEAAQTVVPELSPPTSKSLMFKEYNQYPKYAPQILQEYYSGKTKKHVTRPYVY